MNLSKLDSSDIKSTIEFCWSNDPDIQKFSRNFELDLKGRLEKELDWINKSSTIKFYKIMDNNNFVGYYGNEGKVLTTFFIMPEYRKQKDEVWKYISSQFDKEFFSGLYKMNTRAINFFLNQGGIKVADSEAENKPVVIFKFEVE